VNDHLREGVMLSSEKLLLNSGTASSELLFSPPGAGAWHFAGFSCPWPLLPSRQCPNPGQVHIPPPPPHPLLFSPRH
jgi:hypothetical protein